MSTQGIYRGPLNFSRPADSYHIGPDGTPQLATYFLPEPRYGYDQLGNPQYGTDQIDAQGNIIPQYNRAMAARYDSAGNRLVGNTVSTGVVQGDATYDPRVGQQQFTDTSAAFIDDFGNRISQGANYVPPAPPPPPTSRFVESFGQGTTSGVSRNDLMGRTRVSASEPLAFGNPAMAGRSENIVRSSSRNPNLDMGFGGNFQRRPNYRSGEMGDKPPSRPKPKVDPRDKDLRRGTMASSGEGGN
tara:strand:+ start:313 stop:1044 length:732 start_codon:yes stop_codon:yes gene_type:complete